jgi:hypothetical protein
LESTEVTSVTKGMEHRFCPTNFRLSKHTDMTIHWKALDEHFLMYNYFFNSTIFGEKMHFLNFSQKPQPLIKELNQNEAKL